MKTKEDHILEAVDHIQRNQEAHQIHLEENINKMNRKEEGFILGKIKIDIKKSLSFILFYRNNGNCFICGKDDHWVSKCPLGKKVDVK
jgi:hypothetical protein